MAPKSQKEIFLNPQLKGTETFELFTVLLIVYIDCVFIFANDCILLGLYFLLSLFCGDSVLGNQDSSLQ